MYIWLYVYSYAVSDTECKTTLRIYSYWNTSSFTGSTYMYTGCDKHCQGFTTCVVDYSLCKYLGFLRTWIQIRNSWREISLNNSCWIICQSNKVQEIKCMAFWCIFLDLEYFDLPYIQWLSFSYRDSSSWVPTVLPSLICLVSR